MTTTQQAQFLQDLNENSGLLHRICRIYFTDTDDREDVFQEMVYQLWKSYPSFKGESKISTWMYRVALNTAITHVKNQSKQRSEPISDYITEKHADPDAGEEEQLQQLYAAIQTLSLVDRAIILLHLEGNNYDEIAQVTGLTKVNVSVRLVRIKKKLEEKLKS